MGLFDKVKKAAPTVGTSVASAGIGAVAATAFVNLNQSNDEEDKTESGSSLSSEDPNSIYNTETGSTTLQYPNGNVATEYADGSRSFYDSASGVSTAYNAKTGETVTYGSAENFAVNPSDTNQFILESDRNDFGQSLDTPSVKVSYDPSTGNTILEGYDGINTGVFNSNGELISTLYADSSESTPVQAAGGLFARIRDINSEIPDPLKAAGLGIPDQPVQEFRTYKEGSLKDGQVRSGYEARVGWESTYHTTHSGQDEILPGATLNSEATYDAESFIGASSKGEAGVEWNREEAHLYAQGRSMVGAEANVNAGYKGALDVEGVNYQPGAEVQGHASAFAGAEVEGRGDLNISSEGAQGRIGGEAFAGAKAEAGGSGALSIDGNEFARGGGGVDARAGAGEEFDAGLGYQNGQIEYGIDMGLAVGVGAGIEYSGSVDAPGILTHPDAVWEGAVKEVSSYMPEVPNISVDPNTYVNQAEQYVEQQIQEHVPIAEEVSQFVETTSDIGNTLEDFGSSFGL
jgi:hypothetical protein